MSEYIFVLLSLIFVPKTLLFQDSEQRHERAITIKSAPAVNNTFQVVYVTQSQVVFGVLVMFLENCFRPCVVCKTVDNTIVPFLSQSSDSMDWASSSCEITSVVVVPSVQYCQVPSASLLGLFGFKLEVTITFLRLRVPTTFRFMDSSLTVATFREPISISHQHFASWFPSLKLNTYPFSAACS